MIGGRQPTRPGPDDQHPLAAASAEEHPTPTPAPPPGPRGSARPSGSTPRCRARRDCSRSHKGGSRPDHGSRQRVVGDQSPPRLLVTAGLDVRQPGLDVLTGRTPSVARRQQVHVHRAPTPDRPGPPRPCTKSGSEVRSRQVTSRLRVGGRSTAGGYRGPGLGRWRRGRLALERGASCRGTRSRRRRMGGCHRCRRR